MTSNRLPPANQADEDNNDKGAVEVHTVMIGAVFVVVGITKGMDLEDQKRRPEFWRFLQATAEQAAASGAMPADVLAHIKENVEQTLKTLAFSQN